MLRRIATGWPVLGVHGIDGRLAAVLAPAAHVGLASTTVTCIRTMATLKPLPTSKKSTSRHLVYPGLPYKKLTRKQSRTPVHNPQLEANMELSRRERHWRLILAQASCVGVPHNPDLSQRIYPVWLKVSPADERYRIGSSSSSSAKDGGIAVTAGNDPVVQSSAHTRIVRGFTATRDSELMTKWRHAGTLGARDVEVVRGMEERVRDVRNVPLLDRVLAECDRAVAASTMASGDVSSGGSSDATSSGSSNGLGNTLLSNDSGASSALSTPTKSSDTTSNPTDMALQHQLTPDQLSSIIGSPTADLGKAISTNAPSITADIRRTLVQQIVGASTADGRALYRMRQQRVRAAFGKHPGDHGSAQVQCM